jgi:hypothetical protein
LDVTIPFHFAVEADSQAEAEEMVRTAIAEEGMAFYASCGGELHGEVEGVIVITNAFYLPAMTEEGDDPFYDPSDS